MPAAAALVDEADHARHAVGVIDRHGRISAGAINADDGHAFDARHLLRALAAAARHDQAQVQADNAES
jgi:hypothetical protein